MLMLADKRTPLLFLTVLKTTRGGFDKVPKENQTLEQKLLLDNVRSVVGGLH